MRKVFGDRVTRAYIMIMLTMILAVALTVREAHRADRVVAKSSRAALVLGLRSGCDELTNPIRQAVQQAISLLELNSIERGDSQPINPISGENGYERARQAVAPINCEFYARHRAKFMKLPGD